MRQNSRRQLAPATASTPPSADVSADAALPLVLLGPGGAYSYAIEGGADDARAIADVFPIAAHSEPTRPSWSLEFLVSLTGLVRTTAVFALRAIVSAVALIAAIAAIALNLLHRSAARLADLTDRATLAMPGGAMARSPKPSFAGGFAPTDGPSELPTRPAPRDATANRVDAVSLELRRAMETLRPPLFGGFGPSRPRTTAGRSARGERETSLSSSGRVSSPRGDEKRRPNTAPITSPSASSTTSSVASPRARAAAAHASTSSKTFDPRGTRHESHSQATSHSPDHSRLATSLWRLADDARDRVASRREQGHDL